MLNICLFCLFNIDVNCKVSCYAGGHLNQRFYLRQCHWSLFESAQFCGRFLLNPVSKKFLLQLPKIRSLLPYHCFINFKIICSLILLFISSTKLHARPLCSMYSTVCTYHKCYFYLSCNKLYIMILTHSVLAQTCHVKLLCIDLWLWWPSS